MRKIINFLNPKVSDFLTKKPKLTMVGLYWSLIWRFLVITYGIILIFSIFIAGLGVMIG